MAPVVAAALINLEFQALVRYVQLVIAYFVLSPIKTNVKFVKQVIEKLILIDVKSAMLPIVQIVMLTSQNVHHV